MDLHVEQRGDVLIIDPMETRIDAHVAPEFKRRGLELISQGHKKLLVDLSKVEFVDSSGLGALVSFLKALGREGAIALVGMAPAVREVFRLTRLQRVFQIFPSVEEALQYLNSS